MRERSRELILFLAVCALALSEAANKTAKKDGKDTDTFLYQDEEYVDYQDVKLGEDRPCPRDCLCTVSQGYRIANCNRLEVGTQNFSDDITDLVIENADPSNPIQLDNYIFKKLGLHQIATIKIVNSTITQVGPKAFHGLEELYAVNLSNNKLKSLHPETFANNKKLLLLTLSSNPLQFPAFDSTDYFLNTTSVQELDISFCNMQYITSNTFKNMPGLMYLNVAGNDLSELDPDSFRMLPDLEEIDLSDNNIKSLPDDIFSENKEVATLHIQRNPMNTVYGLQISDLLTLNAGQINIKFIGPFTFNGMKYLANLNLSGNSIEQIHYLAFNDLAELNYLDLSFNNLSSISGELIKENVELDIFKISNNPHMKHLPKEGFSCASDLFNIYLFDASNCGLEEVYDDALKTFTDLTQINLSYNKITSISDQVFSRCPRLVQINLSYNMLTTLDSKVFDKNQALAGLNLQGNPIKVLSADLFIQTPMLTWLDISHAELTSLWKLDQNSSVKVLSNLSLLNVSHNHINIIKQTELDTLTKLSTLDISDNPLVCNRDFEYLMTWLNNRNVSPYTTTAAVANINKDVKEDEDNTEYSWEFLSRKICESVQSHPVEPLQASEEEIWEINKDSDYENDEDEYGDMELKAQIIDEPDNKDPLSTEIPENVDIKLLDHQRVDDTYDDLDEYVQARIDGEEHGRYEYLWPLLIAILGALLLLIGIAKVVMVVCNRRNRHIRYNSAIIAAMSQPSRTKKDCGLVYQQLSEDLTGPTTPKLNRYTPVHTVTIKAANLSYESSPFHHNKIVPEAV